MIKFHRANRSDYFSSMTPGWILGVIFFAAAVLSLFFLNRWGGTNFSLCPFRSVTGFPCFLCGGTTASIHLASGNPLAALSANPLVSVCVTLFAIWSLLWVGFGLRAELPLPRAMRISALILCIAVNWAYLISQRTHPTPTDRSAAGNPQTEAIAPGFGDRQSQRSN